MIISYFLLLKIDFHQQKVLKLKLPKVKFYHSSQYQSLKQNIILTPLKLIVNRISAKIILSYSQVIYKEVVKMVYKV